ncbi:MAG: hypothetical protein H6622_05010 [Halobacteriovoraceae bacterium]|nr:hypothetical protein [Halobacteriovoraceae bacterium]
MTIIFATGEVSLSGVHKVLEQIRINYMKTNSYVIIFLLNTFMAYVPIISAYADELVVVQSVSTTKKRFVIRRGKKTGILIGQESLFSTPDLSLVATCIEATSDHSLWQVNEPDGMAPFSRKEIVVFEKSLDKTLDTLWTETPELRESFEQFKKYREEQEIAELGKLRVNLYNFWLLRGGYAFTLSETVSTTSEGQTNQRQGLRGEIDRYYQITDAFAWSWGLRYDYDTLSVDTANIVIPSNRYLLMADVYYNFDKILDDFGNFYFGLGIGAGYSESSTEGIISAGYAFVSPSFKIGYFADVSKYFTLFVEFSGEAISITEAFSDGSELKTGLINTLFSTGIKF